MEASCNRNRHFGIQEHVRIDDSGMQDAPHGVNERERAAIGEWQAEGERDNGIDGKSDIDAAQEFIDTSSSQTGNDYRRGTVGACDA